VKTHAVVVVIIWCATCIVESEVFEFFVRARKRNVSAHLEVPVKIYIMGTTDEPPVFEETVYRFHVLEGGAVSSTVGTVTAQSNGSIVYRSVMGIN